MERVLIKCSWLVTLDPTIGYFKNGEVLFSRNRIEAVGASVVSGARKASLERAAIKLASEQTLLAIGNHCRSARAI